MIDDEESGRSGWWLIPFGVLGLLAWIALVVLFVRFLLGGGAP
jgi:hypothetical protein